MPFGPAAIQQGANRFVNGRVNAIAINPNNPNLVYLGAAGGGLWRSTNAASPGASATWTPLYDQQASLGIGEPSAVAIDPSNTSTLYVGTSAQQGQVKNISKGILKSIDSGGSWVVLGADCVTACANTALTLFGGADVNSIIVDPSNSSILYVASGIGLFRSTDGGLNWTLGVNGGGNAQSLVIDRTSPAANRILYAGVNGTGILQSTDGGQNWSAVAILSRTTPAVANALTAVAPPGTGIGRVMVALAPPSSPQNAAGIQVLYATIQGTGGFFNGAVGSVTPLGIFQTVDQGATFTQRAATGLGSSFTFFAMNLAVDPASPGDGSNDILYWGGITYHRSTDAGATFSNVSNGLHPDCFTFGFGTSATGSTIVFTGNDGGIFRSDDNGGSWTGSGAAGAPPTINAGGLQTTLFYHMDFRRDATASTTIGATQDNGVNQTCPAGACTAPANWIDRTGGDGIDSVFDAQTTTTAYAVVNISATTEDIFLSTNSGANFTAIGAAQGIPAAELQIFNNRVAVDPSRAGFIYVSGSATSLFQNKNAGAFTNIQNFGAAPGSVAVAPTNSNNVAVAVGGGVFVSTNVLAATPTFTNISNGAPTSLPGRSVNQVAFDPNDPTVVYAVLAGFDSFGATGHVFRRTINGATWTDISPPLDLPVLTIALDGTAVPTAIYVGTAVGVLRSVDGGTSWTALDDVHLPNVPVTELRFNPTNGVLRAATFGRGVFDFVPARGPVISINAQDGLNFGTICGVSSASRTIQVFNVGTQDLIINSVQNLFNTPGFTVLSNPSTPVTIRPNGEVDFTVQFRPTTGAGAQNATIRISSNDPGAPSFDLVATGASGTPQIATVIANSGNIGNVCIGSFADSSLTINNTGACTLSVTDITSSSPEFKTAGTVSFPLQVAAGAALQVPIRLEPTIFGAKTGTISVSSNDPARPIASVAVSGNAPRPRETNTSCNFLAINSGGPTIAPFLSDRNVSGGTPSTSAPVSVSGVILPAPAKVYQTLRFGNFTYTLSNFTPGSNHAVRLHFSENFFNSANQRIFNVTINGVAVLTNFDIFKVAGGKLKAIIKEFSTSASSTGQIVIKFVKVKDNASINGIEIE